MLPQVENIAGSKELRNKILFTLALLVVYRLGIHIPVPGVDGQAVSDFFDNWFIYKLACDIGICDPFQGRLIIE